MDDLPDTWLTVWEDESCYTVDVADEPRIDAAVSAFIDSGGTRDSIIALEFTDGRQYHVRASQITGWSVSTQATRRRNYELKKAQEDEGQRLKAEVGIWEDD